MGSAIGIDRDLEILSVPLQEIQRVWSTALENPDSLSVQIANQSTLSALGGNAAAIVQQLVACTDIGVGWAPWQSEAAALIGKLDTVQLVSGILIERIIAGDGGQGGLSAAEIKALVELAVRDVLLPLLDLISVIPVVGWIIDLVVGFAMAIVQLVELAKKSQAIQDAETTTPPAVPDPIADSDNLEALLELCRSHDWTAIWLPTADPTGDPNVWERGWSCALVEDGGPFARFRQLQPLGDFAWGVGEDRGFGRDRTRGLGAIPGTQSLNRIMQFGGELVVDSGDWFPQTRSAVLQAWSLVWTDGPGLWLIDPHVIETAWRRYVSEFLKTLRNGNTCKMLNSAQRRKIRDHFVSRVGVSVSTEDDRVPDIMGPTIAMQALAARQAAFAKRTSVAYAWARYGPPGLRTLIEDSQAALLKTHLVCSIDKYMVADGYYRTQLETAQDKRGLSCYVMTDVGLPDKSSPQTMPGAPPIPPIPRAAIPTGPRKVKPKPKPRASTSTRGSKSGPPARGSKSRPARTR